METHQYRNGKIWLDSKNLSNSFGLKLNPIQLLKKLS
jgi:hypothetical protein